MNQSVKGIIIVIAALFLVVFVWKNSAFFSDDASGSSRAKRDISQEEQFWTFMNAGDEYRLKGDYKNAEVSYTKALDIKENHAGALYYLGNVQLFMRDFKNAEKNWRHIVKNDPIVARAWLQLGRVYFCMDSENKFYDPAEAEGYFQKAAALNRENTGPPLHLAKIAILKNDYQSADEYLEGIVAQNFKSYEGMFLKGFVDWKMKRTESSLIELSNAVETFSKNNQIKMAGEGATKSGSNPMLTEEKFCDFFGREIQALMIKADQAANEEIYQNFDAIVENWRTGL